MVRRAAATTETLLPWGPILVGVGAVVGLLVTAIALPLGLPGEPVAGDRPPPAAAPPLFPSEPPGPPVDPEGQDSRAQDPGELERGSGESRGGDRADRGTDNPGGAGEDAAGRESGGANGGANGGAEGGAGDDGGDAGGGTAAPDHLAAAYRVVTAFDDEFIAEVKVSNRTTQPQDWTVRLRYPDSVGKLQVAWVESAPQADIRVVNGTFVFSGTEPVAGRGSVVLRVRFDRRGPDISPALCTVNGAGCVVS